ncbi:hypothetical protein [Myxacorys almedinensis]|uniref:Uncharacterized protein n=1 Tax=Myxacorys almedinensis A TaxID=2690445 RepID=A0A8J7YW51_9CYAN|nr:hypothetical protein [Myxacorys almedinensis]NDJ15704.1 hypothetical protein [Myxacorys almedinensis A]
MKSRRNGWIGLAVGALIALLFLTSRPALIMAQAPSPSPSGSVGVPVDPIPVDPSLPNPRPPIPSPSPSVSPSPSGSPTIAPAPIAPGGFPSVPVPAAPTAPPLPVGGEYLDPGGQFKVGILRDFKVSPLAGSVLIESPDGNIAYTVQVQPQSQLGVAGVVLSNEALVTVVQNAFKQGEGFATGEVRSIAGGVQLDWTGNLTIAGQTQPVGGVILSRQVPEGVLLLLIAATEAGGDRVLGAASALVDGFQSLQ